MKNSWLNRIWTDDNNSCLNRRSIRQYLYYYFWTLIIYWPVPYSISMGARWLLNKLQLSIEVRYIGLHHAPAPPIDTFIHSTIHPIHPTIPSVRQSVVQTVHLPIHPPDQQPNSSFI